MTRWATRRCCSIGGGLPACPEGAQGDPSSMGCVVRLDLPDPPLARYRHSNPPPPLQAHARCRIARAPHAPPVPPILCVALPPIPRPPPPFCLSHPNPSTHPPPPTPLPSPTPGLRSAATLPFSTWSSRALSHTPPPPSPPSGFQTRPRPPSTRIDALPGSSSSERFAGRSRRECTPPRRCRQSAPDPSAQMASCRVTPLGFATRHASPLGQEGHPPGWGHRQALTHAFPWPPRTHH